MKVDAVIVSRNDGYGGKLEERATFCLNSAIDTYDTVYYIDWNSPSHSLLYDIQHDLQLKGNLKHYVINPQTALVLTKDENAQKCCEVLARNIGLRRSDADWIVSTNIDIISPPKQVLQDSIKDLDSNTFWTVSRRDASWDMINEYYNNGPIDYADWKNLRKHLIEISEERHYEEKTTSDDDYSIINCCGDYQIAHSNIWNTIRGFEEDLIYSLYTDTNVQKKAVMHGFDLKAIYSPPFFHIEHKGGGGGFVKGLINKTPNNLHRAITLQGETHNSEMWGFSSIEIEYELL